MGKISRRAILAGAGAIAGTSIVSRRARAQAGEFKLKYGNDLPAAHPINKRATEACDAIRAATNGRVDIQIFPNSQLGGSTDMLSQVRSGALDIFTVGSPLANLIPVSAIPSIAFAFPNFDGVWAAVDGDLGAHIRQQVATIGLVAFDKMWDNGFRQITTSTKPINTPDDLKGMKLRVPVSPLFTSMFRALGTAPTAINFNRGLHLAADQGGRRAGKSARADRRGEILRSAEILLAHRPHVGRLLDGGEQRNWEQLPPTCARPPRSC